VSAPLIRKVGGYATFQSTRRRYLIRGGSVITMDPSLGNLTDGDVLIEDGLIARVAPHIEADGCDVIDATDSIVAPGLIDTHRHVWQSILRFIAPDWSHADYFHAIRGVFGARFGPDEMYIANLLGAVEALDSGITTMLDWCHNINNPEAADAAIQGLRDSGLRTVFAYGNSNDEWNPLPNDQPLSDDARRVRSEHFSSDDQLTTMAVCLRGPQFSTLEATRADFELARDIAVPIEITVGAGRWSSRVQPVRVLDRLGLLGDDITYVHCNTLEDDEIRLIADSGGCAAISPEVEMSMGLGYPATGRLAAAGVAPTPSVDVVTHISGELFTVMRMALAAERSRCHEEARGRNEEITQLELSADDMLRYATADAARAVKLDHKVGRLTPGMDADVIIVDTRAVGMFPVNNPIGTLVYGTRASDVRDIFVRGSLVKRDGFLVGTDVDRIRRMADEARDHILEGSGFEPGFDWRMSSPEWSAPDH
jgi:cytosine/adenosine deaminase-related metal-dependent hydrolase